ncbi:hypothetical protein H0264_22620 [Nocardia huaxiensis]|uniref:Aminoglycoside phosphotransferase domain-containing protein n=1 Tax=Nocardia huaxiensis TaxID=2755382 RepID=A0A7D6Z1F1_9NOCA|nr:hypothetical protein [Nocardia huaxiensis]QLY28184.1 hypothetical protein H0264_22620 [Nocardia huaxiensis]
MTERYGVLDPELYQGLDREVAEVLADWAELHTRHYKLARWLVNGRSLQPVAVVRETDGHTGRSTMLVLKVMSPQGDSLQSLEYARHRKAQRSQSAFAGEHLSTYFHDAVPAPSGRWITFQRIAANSLANTEVLTVLLRRMLKLEDATDLPEYHEIACTPEVFAGACRAVVGGVLGGLAGHPMIPPGVEWSLGTFFHRHLFDQLEPDGRLGAWAREYQADRIRFADEPGLLPNPFAVAQGRLLADIVIGPLLGRSHGDLHTDNALIRVRPRMVAEDYFLIDTALYEDDGPLTRDPVHLLLYIIARSMEAIAPVQQGALIDLILDPIDGPAHLVPGWLSTLIQGIDAETRAWVEESGLEQDWREQTCLSLAACAMLFLGRTSTREIDKPWFLRLAARAVAKFAAARRVPIVGSNGGQVTDVRSPIVPQSATGIGQDPAPVPAAASRQEDESRSARRKKRGTTFNIRLKGAQGVQIGDNGTQENRW